MSDPKLIGELEALIEIAIVRKLKRAVVVQFQDDVTDEELADALSTAEHFEVKCIFGR